MSGTGSAVDNDTIHGSCFCGKTTFRISDPKSSLRRSAFCHCSKCQRLNGAPFIWTTHWKGESVTWPERQPERFEVTEGTKYRLRCPECGSTVGTWNESRQQWSLWPVTFERDPTTMEILSLREAWLRPTAHMYASTSVMAIADGLPIFAGLPEKSERMEAYPPTEGK